ncbi:hypothetical protein FB451DRAFT_1562467 [Mycena latifolia]|nr:hypothetical protein FB451DRAFT_1562467 [Mycena latifolia]
MAGVDSDQLVDDSVAPSSVSPPTMASRTLQERSQRCALLRCLRHASPPSDSHRRRPLATSSSESFPLRHRYPRQLRTLVRQRCETSPPQSHQFHFALLVAIPHRTLPPTAITCLSPAFHLALPTHLCGVLGRGPASLRRFCVPTCAISCRCTTHTYAATPSTRGKLQFPPRPTSAVSAGGGPERSSPALLASVPLATMRVVLQQRVVLLARTGPLLLPVWEVQRQHLHHYAGRHRKGTMEWVGGHSLRLVLLSRERSRYSLIRRRHDARPFSKIRSLPPTRTRRLCSCAHHFLIARAVLGVLASYIGWSCCPRAGASRSSPVDTTPALRIDIHRRLPLRSCNSRLGSTLPPRVALGLEADWERKNSATTQDGETSISSASAVGYFKPPRHSPLTGTATERDESILARLVSVATSPLPSTPSPDSHPRRSTCDEWLPLPPAFRFPASALAVPVPINDATLAA